ncbi:MAG: MGMT family protein [Nanoarchaeota archaeon]
MRTFSQRCYDVLRKVPKGRVTTYAQIARALDTRAYRAVGQAMHRNPRAPSVPCHRVVASDGSLGGFASGPEAKIRMLRMEGVQVEGGRIVDFKKVFYPL